MALVYDVFTDSYIDDSPQSSKNDFTTDPYVQAIGLYSPFGDPYQLENNISPDTQKAINFYNLKTSNPSEYYKQAATGLADKMYFNWKGNNAGTEAQNIRNLFEGIKQYDPSAYYTAKLTDLGRSVGWNVGQNTSDRNAPTIAEIQALIPEAQKAGLSTEQINSLVNSGAQQATSENQKYRAADAGLSGFAPGLGQFAATAAALGLGTGALIEALGPAALAEGGLAEGGAAGQTGMNGALESYFGNTGGTFVPSEGFSATLPSFEAPTAIGDQIGDYPMPGENGTASQWTPSNINPNDVTNLLDYNAAYGSAGTSLNDALNAVNNARKAYGLGNSIASLIGGGATAKASGSTGGTNLSNLASMVRSPSFTPMQAATIQSKNPFLFETPGQTQASEGMYDVSGSNLAKALRKA